MEDGRARALGEVMEKIPSQMGGEDGSQDKSRRCQRIGDLVCKAFASQGRFGRSSGTA